LDASGTRREAIPTSGRQDGVLIELHPKHETLWYEVEIR
jgi:hypothetical protein